MKNVPPGTSSNIELVDSDHREVDHGRTEETIDDPLKAPEGNDDVEEAESGMFQGESSSSPAVPASTSPSTTAPRSKEDWERILSERQVVHMSDDEWDPLEYAFRRVVPLPARYYWDVIPDPAQQAEVVSPGIRRWHQTVAGLEALYSWTERRIARPLANTLGLTSSRFHYMSDFMSEEEKLRSEQIVAERQQRRRPAETDPTVTTFVTTPAWDDDEEEGAAANFAAETVASSAISASSSSTTKSTAQDTAD